MLVAFGSREAEATASAGHFAEIEVVSGAVPHFFKSDFIFMESVEVGEVAA